MRHRMRFTPASASIISGMRSSPLRVVLSAMAAPAMFALASAAWGQVYKCTDAEGRTTYSGAPFSSRIRANVSSLGNSPS